MIIWIILAVVIALFVLALRNVWKNAETFRTIYDDEGIHLLKEEDEDE